MSADHATEWMNGMCKAHNGIIGVTRRDDARDKFCVTWAQKCAISEQIRSIYCYKADTDDEDSIGDSCQNLDDPARLKRDKSDITIITQKLAQFRPF